MSGSTSTTGSSTTTPIIGAPGPYGAVGTDGNSGYSSGGGGDLGGDGQDAINEVTGGSDTDDGSGLSLQVEADGGAGGQGGNGGAGANGPDQYIPPGSGILSSINWLAGLSGGPGQIGGQGGAAAATYEGNQLSTGSDTGGNEYIYVTANGGDGGSGGSGGGGGSSGDNIITYNLNGDGTVLAINEDLSGGGGDGGFGGDGSAGGKATAEAVGDVVTDHSAEISVQAVARGGGGGTGGNGGTGGTGIAPGNGNIAGNGGDGATASAMVANITASGFSGSVNLVAEAYAGDGGQGGDAGGAGTGSKGSVYYGYPGDYTDVVTVTGVAGTPGSGGEGGNASASITGNTIQGSSSDSDNGNAVDIYASAISGSGGRGGFNGVTGVYGGSGTSGTASLDVSGNNIALSGQLAFLEINLDLQNDSGVDIPLSSANLSFSGNTFNGGGQGLLDLSGIQNGSATVDVADGTLSIAGSVPNAMAGFDSFNSTRQDNVFIDGAGDQVYAVGLSDSAAQAEFEFSPGHGDDVIAINDNSSFQIDLDGFGPDLTSYAQVQAVDGFNPEGEYGALIETPDGGSILIEGVDASQLTASEFEFSSLCFCADTLIRTPAGETPVENLREGDRVLLRSGKIAPVAWIGHGRVLATRGRRSAATPVIIRKSAFADNIPSQDLHVTKGHAFHFDGALIPIEFLVNHRSILWDDRAQEVRLYHIELANHDILLANGAEAESYRDDGNRWLFQNANSGWHLPPKPPCFPVLTGGAFVDTVWRRLLDRSGWRPGLPLTDDPDLHLVVDGERLEPLERQRDKYVFRLGKRPGSLRIRSRAAVPQELGLARDTRLLGVALRRIVLAEAGRKRVIEASDDVLTDGYHAYEPEAEIRWTDGDAIVPPSGLDGLRCPFMVILYLGGTTKYVDGGRSEMAA